MVEDDVIIAAMPRIARDLVERVGFKPALTLLHEYRGGRLYVPLTLARKPGQQLAQLLGPKAAQVLITAYPGKQFDVPNMASVERLLRDNAIRADFDAGMSLRDLRKRYRLTSRNVRRIVAKG